MHWKQIVVSIHIQQVMNVCYNRYTHRHTHTINIFYLCIHIIYIFYIYYITMCTHIRSDVHLHSFADQLIITLLVDMYVTAVIKQIMQHLRVAGMLKTHCHEQYLQYLYLRFTHTYVIMTTLSESFLPTPLRRWFCGIVIARSVARSSCNISELLGRRKGVRGLERCYFG